MDLRRIRYFVEVANELHFGRAAAKLHMAQPPLSLQIRRLEAELGFELFDRTTRRVALSPEGSALLADAREVLSRLERFERHAASLRSGEEGVLHLGFVDSACYKVMPQFLQAFRTRWPDVEHQLKSLSSDEQLKALEAGTIDVGLARTAGTSTEVEADVVLHERLVVAVDGAHRLVGHPDIAISDLVGEFFIGFDRQVSPSLHREIVGMLAAQGVAYDPFIEATEYATILSLVASGQGVAIVPASVRSFRPPTLRYLDLSDPAAISTLLLLRRKAEPGPIVAKAVQLASELFG